MTIAYGGVNRDTATPVGPNIIAMGMLHDPLDVESRSQTEADEGVSPRPAHRDRIRGSTRGTGTLSTSENADEDDDAFTVALGSLPRLGDRDPGHPRP